MATNYGSDTACTTDLPLISTPVTDPKTLIGQRIYRRLTTPRGALALIGGNGDGGWDVRQLVNMKMTPAKIAAAQQQIEGECLKDEQVSGAAVEVTSSAGNATIAIALTTAFGPFRLTLNVSVLTAELVFE